MEELTRERALELHRQMWTDMQRDLGDNPSKFDREPYKKEWCRKHSVYPLRYCFLCEYVYQHDPLHRMFSTLPCTTLCPIAWDTREGTCLGMTKNGWFKPYLNKPISWILAQLEREETNNDAQ